jgi:hypothetical protein
MARCEAGAAQLLAVDCRATTRSGAILDLSSAFVTFSPPPGPNSQATCGTSALASNFLADVSIGGAIEYSDPATGLHLRVTTNGSPLRFFAQSAAGEVYFSYVEFLSDSSWQASVSGACGTRVRFEGVLQLEPPITEETACPNGTLTGTIEPAERSVAIAFDDAGFRVDIGQAVSINHSEQCRGLGALSCAP